MQPHNRCLEDRGSQRLDDVYDDQMNVDLDDLTVYDYQKFLWNHGNRIGARCWGLSCYPVLLCEGLPVEHIEKIDDRNLYVIYKVQGEDIGQAYLYVRYTETYPDEADADADHPFTGLHLILMIVTVGK